MKVLGHGYMGDFREVEGEILMVGIYKDVFHFVGMCGSC